MVGPRLRGCRGGEQVGARTHSSVVVIGEFLPCHQHPCWRDFPRMPRERAAAALASISQMGKPVAMPGSLWRGLLLFGLQCHPARAPPMGKHAACAEPAAPEAGSGQPQGRTSFVFPR